MSKFQDDTDAKHKQQAYWDALAPVYDTLYGDQWSSLENHAVIETLAWLKRWPAPRLLDLGCGTGLGFDLCNAVNSNTQYTGSDPSIASLPLETLRDLPHTAFGSTSGYEGAYVFCS